MKLEIKKAIETSEKRLIWWIYILPFFLGIILPIMLLNPNYSDGSIQERSFALFSFFGFPIVYFEIITRLRLKYSSLRVWFNTLLGSAIESFLVSFISIALSILYINLELQVWAYYGAGIVLTILLINLWEKWR